MAGKIRLLDTVTGEEFDTWPVDARELVLQKEGGKQRFTLVGRDEIDESEPAAVVAVPPAGSVEGLPPVSARVAAKKAKRK